MAVARPNLAMSRAQVERLVRGSTAVRRGFEVQHRDYAAPVVERILRTGECVWHAAAVVQRTPCWCAHCHGRRPEEEP